MDINPYIRPLWAISLEAAYAADMAAQEQHQRQQSRAIRDGPTAPYGQTRPGGTDEAMQARPERFDQGVALDFDAAVMSVGEARRIVHQKDSGLDLRALLPRCWQVKLDRFGGERPVEGDGHFRSLRHRYVR